MSLPKMHINVELKDQPDPLEVQAINPDLIRFETERKKWGLLPQDEAPMTWITFLAWAALTRENRYSKPWQEFKLQDCLAVDMPDEDEVEDVDPTTPGDESDSASG